MRPPASPDFNVVDKKIRRGYGPSGQKFSMSGGTPFLLSNIEIGGRGGRRSASSIANAIRLFFFASARSC